MSLGTPYTIVSGSQGPSVSATLQVTVEATSAAGDAVAVAATTNAAGETVTGVTDSQGNLYVLLGSDYNQKTGIAAYAALNATPLVNGVDWIQARFSGSLGAQTLNGRGCSGVALAGAVDQAVSSDATDSTAILSGAMGSLRSAAEWAVGFAASGDAGGVPSGWTGGFTAQDTVHPAGNQYQTVVDRVTVSTVPLSTTATVSDTHWAMVLATFTAGIAPLYAPSSPARAQIPRRRPRAGRTSGSVGAPVNNTPQPSGPRLYPALGPVRSRVTPPPRGRATGSRGAPVGVRLVNNADGGTNGTTVTTGNSGGASGNAWNTVTIGAAATLTFDNTHAAHGSLSYNITTGSPAASALLRWNAALVSPAVSQAWVRVYVYMTAAPGSNLRLVRWTNSGGATVCGDIAIGSTGKVALLDSAGATQATSATVIPLNTWFRVEGYLIASATAGQVQAQIYTSADGLTAREILTTGSALNTSGTITGVDFGNPSSIASYTMWLDDLGASTIGYLGPASLTGPASLGHPVAAAHPPPSPRQRGCVTTSTPAGAPLRNPTAGPPARPLRGPVRSCVAVPPRGRAAGGAGAPVSNPVPAAVGPPVYPLRCPVRARILAPARGRPTGSAGAAVSNPAPAAPFDGVPAQAAPAAFVPARPPAAAGAPPPPPPPPPPGTGGFLPLFPP